MIDPILSQPPFGLAEREIQWVRDTLSSLKAETRLSQLFNLLVTEDDASLVQVDKFQPGGVTCFLPPDASRAHQLINRLRAVSRVPLIVSADVEGGEIGPACLTPMPNQLGMAAVADADLYKQAVEVMAAEAYALGIDWSFTPVIDINANFRSAIVATRSFGRDPARIEAWARTHVSSMQAAGVAATAKHWPGEGFDDRDQHLVTTICPLTMRQWQECFGKLYRAIINQGVLTIMSGHIALPAYAQQRGYTGIELFRPASVSNALNTDLLRNEIGFNGLLVSDATIMGGLESWGPREITLPEVIENGCDMILFARNMTSDIAILQRALEEGRLSDFRVEQALLRILGLKAKLHLHDADEQSRRGNAGKLHLVGCTRHHAVTEAAAAASPTLVKDVDGILPLTPDRYPRLLLVNQNNRTGFGAVPPQPLIVDRLLREAGFEVQVFDKSKLLHPEAFDAVVLVLAQESLAAKSNIYLDWLDLFGSLENSMRRAWHERPMLLLSFGHPYYLYDAPRMPCVINAYCAIEAVQKAVVRKLTGTESFIGVSPVDPLCGVPDAVY